MTTHPVALITGGSRGLGRALVRALAARGWSIVTDGRDHRALSVLAAETPGSITVVAGDVADPGHRAHLIAEVEAHGRLDLLVNNASTLGPTPMPTVADLDAEELTSALVTNTVAPAALIRAALPLLRAAGQGTVLNVTSDAAVEAYPTWGAYASGKAALEQLSRVLAEEEPDVRVLVVDPGDMRTDLHQAAFPGEDISDRPPPEDSVPGILSLLDRGATGRHQAQHAGAAAT